MLLKKNEKNFQKTEHSRTTKLRKNHFSVSGSFTVEAALLMSLIIPILAAMIYVSFYLHDAAVLQGIACELAVMGRNLDQEKNPAAELENRRKDLIRSRFTEMERPAVSVSDDGRKISVSGSGEITFPGLILKYFGGNSRKIIKNWEKERISPAEKIRKIRGLEVLVEVLRE